MQYLTGEDDESNVEIQELNEKLRNLYRDLSSVEGIPDIVL